MASIIRNPDGSPRYTNKLNQSASPYLLQHAHNPVDWHPWGPEALALAKRENKPIFLSIGYSTCYWCHVMEREIFANPTMAALMNQHFINIKVDREERPDLDEIYMAARQLLTGEGGWPNNVFLTPNLEPFFAGGTFSADARYGRMSFPELVQSITQGWMHKREDVFTMSATVMERLNEVLTPNEKGRPPAIGYDRVSYLIQHWIRMHDKRNGGFYSAPKFPNETNLLFLMDVYRLRKDVEVLGVISRTLDTMAAGGIFDHVGGGFHRYAVDAEWKVPHFEKMLYNQALLSLVYAEAAELTGKSYYEYIARSTLDFVLNEMTSAEGAFYSAFDAENDAVEGAYYVWDELTIRKLLSEGAARIFFETFDLAELPHFPGHKHPEGKVLYAKKPIDIAARERDLAFDEFQTQLDKIMGKLLLVREGREVPMLDTKIIAAWNGMMIHSFAQVGMLLEEPRYITAAQKAAEFILNKMTTRNFTIGRIYNTAVQIGGFLEDYAWVVAGLLSVYQATDKKIWLT
ncbi:MAG: thioredoxin domain-containing protein, partial [Proteobacteria bacterium]|nr:thioredoxin domain-containing protein [Pseudomonadota bacterium]